MKKEKLKKQEVKKECPVVEAERIRKIMMELMKVWRPM